MTQPAPEPTHEILTDQRMEVLGLVGACTMFEPTSDAAAAAVSHLINTTEHEPWQLLVVLAQLTAAIVGQVAPALGATEQQYLDQVRSVLLSGEVGL